jgi:hypothetical protein
MRSDNETRTIELRRFAFVMARFECSKCEPDGDWDPDIIRVDIDDGELNVGEVWWNRLLEWLAEGDVRCPNCETAWRGGGGMELITKGDGENHYARIKWDVERMRALALKYNDDQDETVIETSGLESALIAAICEAWNGKVPMVRLRHGGDRKPLPALARAIIDAFGR